VLADLLLGAQNQSSPLPLAPDGRCHEDSNWWPPRLVQGLPRGIYSFRVALAAAGTLSGVTGGSGSAFRRARALLRVPDYV